MGKPSALGAKTVTILCAAASLAAASVFCYRWWTVPLAAVIWFASVWAPGETLRRLLLPHWNEPECRVGAAYVFGLAVAPVVYEIFVWVGYPPAAIVALALIGLPAWRTPPEQRPVEWAEYAWMSAAAGFVAVAFQVPIFRMTGAGLVDSTPAQFSWDTGYNALLANAVRDALPPTNPFFAGIGLNYHLGYPAVAALADPFAGAGGYDVIARASAFWFLFFGLAAVFAVARAQDLSRTAARWAASLAMLGGGVVATITAVWNAGNAEEILYGFRMVTISNLITNATLTAVPLLFAASAAAGEHLETRERRTGTAAVVLLTALMFHKSFFHAVVLSGWAAAVLVRWVRDRRLNAWALAGAIVASAPLGWWYWLGNQTGSGLALHLTPGFIGVFRDLPIESLRRLAQAAAGDGLTAWIAAGIGTVLFVLWFWDFGVLGLPRLFVLWTGRGPIRQSVAAWSVASGTAATAILYDVPHVHVSSEWFALASQSLIALFAGAVLAARVRGRTLSTVCAVVLFLWTTQSVLRLGAERWSLHQTISIERVEAAVTVGRRAGRAPVVFLADDRTLPDAVLAGGVLYESELYGNLTQRYLSVEEASLREERIRQWRKTGRLDVPPELRERAWACVPRDQPVIAWPRENQPGAVLTREVAWAPAAN